MTPYEIARVAHEVNRAYCQALGDFSQPAWENAPDWQVRSALKGVALHLENPNAGPEASHESWLEEKKADGWTFGRIKNPEKKEHPCYVPFGMLPPEQRAKDFIFCAVVRALAGEAEAVNYAVGQAIPPLQRLMPLSDIIASPEPEPFDPFRSPASEKRPNSPVNILPGIMSPIPESKPE